MCIIDPNNIFISTMVIDCPTWEGGLCAIMVTPINHDTSCLTPELATQNQLTNDRENASQSTIEPNVEKLKLVYLIGTRHNYQTGFLLKEQEVAKFDQVIRDMIARHGILGVGEEISTAVFAELEIESTVAFRVCQELKLPHRYCDADSATKVKLGIGSNAQREQFWMNQLQEFSIFPVLFICGSMHCRTFELLLKQSGFDPLILYSNWPKR